MQNGRLPTCILLWRCGAGATHRGRAGARLLRLPLAACREGEGTMGERSTSCPSCHAARIQSHVAQVAQPVDGVDEGGLDHAHSGLGSGRVEGGGAHLERKGARRATWAWVDQASHPQGTV